MTEVVGHLQHISICSWDSKTESWLLTTWIATLSVFSGSGPLGQQFLMICSSCPGKHPLTFFPLVFIFFFFPWVCAVLWHSRLRFAVQFWCDPENEQEETCMLLLQTSIRSWQVIFVATLQAPQRNPVVRLYIPPNINNHPLVLLNVDVQTQVSHECHHAPFSLPVQSAPQGQMSLGFSWRSFTPTVVSEVFIILQPINMSPVTVQIIFPICVSVWDNKRPVSFKCKV